MQNVPNPSRRLLFRNLASALRSFAPSGAGASDDIYQITDQRKLPGGGVGLFVVVSATPTREALLEVIQRLRTSFHDEPNVVAVVFDNFDAANTVRSGSRIVGEERFAAAKCHQKASYTKYSRTGSESLTIFNPVPETITF